MYLEEVRNLCSPNLHVPYEGKRKKPWLLQSVFVIVSKLQVHEKVSSEDLAVAGDVPDEDTSMVTESSPLSSGAIAHHFPKCSLQCFLVQVNKRSSLKTLT